MVDIQKIVGCKCDTVMQAHIDLWKEIYKGVVPSFHNYKIYNGKQFVGRERKSLRMGKRICEDWANLLMNEKVQINVDDDALNERIYKVFEENNFYVEANALIEKSFAFGSGAFTEYKDNDGRIHIDYITADMIYPISWTGSTVTECAFVSVKVIGGVSCYYVNIHRIAGGEYVVYNRLYEKDGFAEISLPSGVLGEWHTGSMQAKFQIIRPNTVNNMEYESPLGISILANAWDEIRGIDLVYDSYMNEFTVGKKRIIVPETMAQRQLEKDGITEPVFDTNDTVFYAIPGKDDGTQMPKEIDMNIRGTEHKDALQQCLNLLSDKCGLGSDRYSYSRHEVKTATEVVSEQSELFRNLKKHEILLKSALIGLVRSLVEFMDYKGDVTVKIDFDDSIIEDKGTEFTRRLQLVQSGVCAPWELRTYYLNETEDAAKKFCAELAAAEYAEE